jgi:metal-responsive CopG/Arc/MetJ family transcriptional regulator
MSKTSKIAVSLDPRLLARVERARAHTGESRSALVSRALELLTSDEERQAKAARYVIAYHERPETVAEVHEGRAWARRVLARLPWDSH